MSSAPDAVKNLNIVYADVEHLDRLAPLFNDYRVWYGKPSDLPGSTHFLFERIINHESVIFLVLDGEQEGARAVGFAQLYMTFSSLGLQPVWVLNDLWVADGWRRKGIARLLVEKAQKLVTDREDKGLQLETAPGNTSAQALYKQLGFVEDNEFSHYYWERPASIP